MVEVNNNKNQGGTGGPANASTGSPAQTQQPDSQKGSSANAIGAKDYVEKNSAPDVSQDGGKQATDPVQND